MDYSFVISEILLQLSASNYSTTFWM